MTICKHCGRESHIICLCGFCPVCINKFGHEALGHKYIAEELISREKRLRKEAKELGLI